MEIEVGGNAYITRPLTARQQRNLTRRLVPLLTAGEPIIGLMKTVGLELSSSVDTFMAAAGPLARAIGDMSDADSDFIFETCLNACQRKVSGGVQRIITANGELVFADIQLAQQLQLTFYILKENLADFFSAGLGQSSTGAGNPA